MPGTSSFRDTVVTRLNLFGAVTARAMFGGYGLYLEGVMFALIAYDTLYFKADDENRDDFVTAGGVPFVYDGKHKPIEMSYYRVPDDIFEDTTALAAWVEKAHAAARRARTNSKPKRRSKRTV